MIVGAHSVIYSSDPDADHKFLRDVLMLPAIDAGGGYLIFGLPPAEASVHPSGESGPQQELFLLCENVEEFIAEMGKHGVACSPVKNEGWGLLTQVTMPGGNRLGVYQAQHERPATMSA